MQAPARLAAAIACGACVAVLAGALARAGSAERAALREARPSLDRFLAALDAGGADELAGMNAAELGAAEPRERLARVLAAYADLLGDVEERDAPDARLDDDGALAVSVRERRERGEAVVEIGAVRGPDGRWRVARCVARTAAFAFVFRS